jgi:hypothetical protein
MILDASRNHRPAGHRTNTTGLPCHVESGGPPAAAVRRSDMGQVRFTGRDIAGLVLVGDMYAAPYDLLGAALRAQPDRVRAITCRWRRAGLAQTGRIGPGPGWCWLTPVGMRAAGLRYPARRPPLARLAHIRAVLATRITLQAGEPFTAGSAWWRSERHIRCTAARTGIGHIPDAEVHWPEVPGSPYPGECWAVEAELTPKGATRTITIMTGLLSRTTGWEPGSLPGRAPRYDHVVYLCAPPALPVVRRAAASLPAPLASRIDVRDLPKGALL